MAPSRHSVLFKLAGKAIDMTNDDQNLAEAGKIRVLLVEDHVLTRIGLKTVLARTSDITVVGEADNGLDAIQKVEELRPDVVLMDVGMPVMDGIEAADKLRTSYPEVNIIMLTSHDNDQDIFASLAAGAGGYCLKDVLPERLYMAIRSVKAGDIWLDSAIASRVIRLYNNPRSRSPQRISGAHAVAPVDARTSQTNNRSSASATDTAGSFDLNNNKDSASSSDSSANVSRRAAQAQSISGSQSVVSASASPTAAANAQGQSGASNNAAATGAGGYNSSGADAGGTGTGSAGAGGVSSGTYGSGSVGSSSVSSGSAGGATSAYGGNDSHHTNLTEPLSPRELEVLALLVEGLSNQDIADRLIISLATAKTHVRNILNKMAVDDRTQAAVLAMRRGLV